MKRVIYSFYIDISADEFVDNVKTNLNTKNQLKENYQRLIDCKVKYANDINVPFKMFEVDEEWEAYYEYFKENRPYITTYNIVNFYKIHLLCQLAKEYDEILYLDFDAVPVTKDSFFDHWDLSKGLCVYNNNSHIVNDRKVKQSIRSPSAKYFNCQAMLIEKNLDPKNDVINTAIIGTSRKQILKLDFFGGFKDTIDLMTKLRNDKSGLYPQNILDMFRYDNETIFSYKVNVNKVGIQWLDRRWHYFLDNQNFIPEETKIVHCVCKDFDIVWRYNA